MERLRHLAPLLALLAAGCTHAAAPEPAPSATASSAAPRPTVSWPSPEALRRPLVRPPLGPGGACPADAPHHVADAFGPGSGPGPAYPVGLRADGTLVLAPVGNFPGPYNGNKVLWVVDSRRYPGPVLIRGLRLDAPGDVRFDDGADPPDAMHLPPPVAPTDWRDWPSYTRVRGPGCYAYQVDGADFSYRVVFRAIDEGSS